MQTIASLPWYDQELEEHNEISTEYEIIWAVLRNELQIRGIKGLPVSLTSEQSLYTQWTHPGLIVGQCCGLDLFTEIGANLVPVARPVFADLDCEPGHYFSYICSAHSPPKKTSVVAINSHSSRSGCTALFEWLTPRYGQPDALIVSSSHQQSLQLLHAEQADFAAIDAFTFNQLDSDGIMIIDRTSVAPAPPFVTRANGLVPPDLLFEALQQTFRSVGHLVGISDVRPASHDTYAKMALDAELMHTIEQTYG